MFVFYNILENDNPISSNPTKWQLWYINQHIVTATLDVCFIKLHNFLFYASIDHYDKTSETSWEGKKQAYEQGSGHKQINENITKE